MNEEGRAVRGEAEGAGGSEGREEGRAGHSEEEREGRRGKVFTIHFELIVTPICSKRIVCSKKLFKDLHCILCVRLDGRKEEKRKGERGEKERKEERRREEGDL